MTKPSGHPRSVLVIDDDPVMRELLVALLGVEEIAVHAAVSGEEALMWLAEQGTGPEVVLTDLQMPDTDIARLVPKLREAPEQGAVLLGMSGSPAERPSLALLDGFLLKPFSTEEFLAAVAEVTQGRAGTVPAADTGGTAPVNPGDDTVPVLDMKIYEKMSASLKPDALAELYQITLQDVRERAAAMGAAHVRGDDEACRREAHAMKGGCGMVGAMELRSQAAALEAGAPADTPALEGLEEACKRLQVMLNARL